MKRPVAVVVVLIALIALPLAAQVSRANENIQVTLVEVPVNVVDRNGAPVRNLTAKNFEVIDNKERRAITHFEAIDLAAGAKNESVDSPAAARNFLLLFDLSGSEPGTLGRAREAARMFVSNAAALADRIAVATFTAETGVHLLTSFTTDRQLVSSAITTLGAPKYFQPVDPLLMTAIEMHQAADEAETSPRPKDQVLSEGRSIARRMMCSDSSSAERWTDMRSWLMFSIASPAGSRSFC